MAGDELVFIGLGLPVLLANIWLIIYALRRERRVDRKIKNCDITILDESGITINRITQGPPGTQIQDNVQLAVVANPVVENQINPSE